MLGINVRYLGLIRKELMEKAADSEACRTVTLEIVHYLQLHILIFIFIFPNVFYKTHFPYENYAYYYSLVSFAVVESRSQECDS